MKLLLAIKKRRGVKGHDRKFMENGKFLNIGPLDRKEYIIEQFHIGKEQNQNHIYVLWLSLVFHTLKKELSIEELS